MPSEGPNEDTKLGHGEVNGFTKSSILITWGHEEVNGFTKSSFLITWGSHRGTTWLSENLKPTETQSQ